MSKRLIDLSLYLGGASFWGIYWKTKHIDSYDNPHYKKIMEINLLQLICFLIFIVIFCLHTLVIRYIRELALIVPLEISFVILGVMIVICLIIRIEGLFSAIVGYGSKIKFGFHIEDSKVKKTVSKIIQVLSQVMVIAVLCVTIHSSLAAGDLSKKHDIYMLYDDMGLIPRWVFTLAFYPESIASRVRFGDDSVAVIPLTEESFEAALNNGKLIFVAAHGADGYIVLQDGSIMWPKDIDPSQINNDLQYVYLSACDTGIKHDEWQYALRNAEVKTFNRLSTVMEHMKWLIFDGPKIIRALKQRV